MRKCLLLLSLFAGTAQADAADDSRMLAYAECSAYILAAMGTVDAPYNSVFRVRVDELFAAGLKMDKRVFLDWLDREQKTVKSLSLHQEQLMAAAKFCMDYLD